MLLLHTNAVYTGSGNISNSPAFVNYTGCNFRLSSGSPCLNSGLNQDWMTNGLDLDRRKRIRYGTVGMGTCEMIKDVTVYRFR